MHRGRANTQDAFFEERAEFLEKLDLEDVPEALVREQEPLHDHEAVLAESTAGHEAVDVGMIVEELVPGVEHREDAQKDTLPGPDVEDGFGGRSEEGFEGVHSSRSQKEWAERGRNREDQVEVGERKQVLLLSLRPDRLVETATTRAVTVSAGIERIVSPLAPVAHEGVTSETTGTAGENVSRNLALLRRQIQGGHVIAQHVGKAERWALTAGHDQFLGVSFRVSSGLFTSPSQFLARRT
jgi:hypothetical protein